MFSPGAVQDLRDAEGNTGNVEENKSLYWNPAIYKVNDQFGDKSYEIVDVWFASAYYIWRTGTATAFPNGLKMKTTGYDKNSRARAVCDGSYTCERDDGCEGYGPSGQAQNGFLPISGCSGKFLPTLTLKLTFRASKLNRLE